MIIIYAPEDGAEEHLNAGRMRASEIQLIERTADAHWKDIREAMSEGDINALRVVAYAIKRRTHAALRYTDFDPWEGELRARLDDDEVRAYAWAILDKYRDKPDELAAAFDELRDSAANPEAADTAIADVTAPKDPAPPEPEPEPMPVGASATA